jgi:hypothetical protein
VRRGPVKAVSHVAGHILAFVASVAFAEEATERTERIGTKGCVGAGPEAACWGGQVAADIVGSCAFVVLAELAAFAVAVVAVVDAD